MQIHGRYYELTSEQRKQLLEKEEQYRNMSLPSDPKHPMFYHVYSDTLPWEVCYRTLPLKRENCANSQKEVGKKGYKRRYIFEGWNNYTQFEREFILQVKQGLKEKYGLDLFLEKK